MKESELRIGNWINSGLSKNALLDDVHFYPTQVYINILKQIIEGDLVWEFEPILLTKEWLLKFGFNKVVVGPFSTYFIGNVGIEFEGAFYSVKLKSKEGNTSRFFSLPIELHYVHQLQNLYFALTGEELSMK